MIIIRNYKTSKRVNMKQHTGYTDFNVRNKTKRQCKNQLDKIDMLRLTLIFIIVIVQNTRLIIFK